MSELLSNKIMTSIGKYHILYCPGCEVTHMIGVEGPLANGAQWTWNGDVEKPTYSPSLLTQTKTIDGRVLYCCHSFLRDGVWIFLDDCTHDLKGQQVPLPDLPDCLLRDEDEE